jgi:hypothetical protein
VEGKPTRAEAPRFAVNLERPKAEALGYLDANARARQSKDKNKGKDKNRSSACGEG